MISTPQQHEQELELAEGQVQEGETSMGQGITNLACERLIDLKEINIREL
jgi:hypothetical protein